MSNSVATSTPRKEPGSLDQNSLLIIVILDVIGFSKFPENRQLQAAEQLNTAMENALLAHGIRQLIGRLPTGDGAALLIQPASGVTRDAVLKFAEELLSDMRESRIFLRIGIHEGAALRATLGTSGQNFCGSAMNLTQRIMDFADGSEREHNGQRRAMHAIACSSDFVRNLSSKIQEHFGKEFDTQAKHGQPVKIRFHYPHPNDIPKDPDNEKVSGQIAAFGWKLQKLRDRGLDFYAFGEEKSPEDKDRLHKQLVGKNFAWKEFKREEVPKGCQFNAIDFEKARLGLCPVNLFLGGHPDFGICGPELDLGDLAFGVYRATFYFSVFERLEEGVTLKVEVCHGTSDPTNPHVHFERLNTAAQDERTCEKIVGDQGVSDEEQMQNGWLSRSFEFRYSGEPFVQLRFVFVDSKHEDLRAAGEIFKRNGRVPKVWFYKVHLKLIPGSD